jgi:heat shock protein HslJ
MTVSMPDDRSTGLAGTSWRLVRIGRKATAGEREVTASFSEDGRLTGSGGCNRYMGGYAVSGESLTIEPLASTRMFCEPEVSDQEARFLATLQASTSWRISDGRLRLTGGAVSLTFEPTTG